MLDSDMKQTPAPVPDYSENGVDLTLIRWMLSLTPAERLDFLLISWTNASAIF
ncbi:MAG: hypothetical protein ACRD4O_14185 [Bryobacteraceae bacterium]